MSSKASKQAAAEARRAANRRQLQARIAFAEQQKSVFLTDSNDPEFQAWAAAQIASMEQHLRCGEFWQRAQPHLHRAEINRVYAQAVRTLSTATY